MKKNFVRKLAQASYTGNSLDGNKVQKISKYLKRASLKIYIKDLRTIEAKKTVFLSVPGEEGLEEVKKYLSNVYPDKKIVVNIDPALLTGIRVVDYDNIYELSLRSFPESAIRGFAND